MAGDVVMKALIITGKYGQDIEIFYPLYRMQEEGWDVDISMPDKEALGIYGMRMVSDISPENIARSLYDVLILPGGARAMEYLRQNVHVVTTVAWFKSYGKLIGSICHGTQLLIEADCIRGRKVSGYYSIKKDIENAGGVFVDAPFVTDGRIVSSPHYKYLGPWMKAVIDHA